MNKILTLIFCLFSLSAFCVPPTYSGKFIGDGALLTNIQASSVSGTITNTINSPNIGGDGSGLTNVSAAAFNVSMTNWVSNTATQAAIQIVASQPSVFGTNNGGLLTLSITNELVVPTGYVATNSLDGSAVEITGDAINVGMTNFATADTTDLFVGAYGTVSAAQNKRYTNQTPALLWRVQGGSANIYITNSASESLYRFRASTTVTLTNATLFGTYRGESGAGIGTTVMVSANRVKMGSIIPSRITLSPVASFPLSPEIDSPGTTNIVFENVGGRLFVIWTTNSVVQSNQIAGPP